MFDSQDELRKALREAGQELGKTMEQAGAMFREVAHEAGRMVGRGALSSQRGQSPVDLIRQLGELRDAGLITEQEFQAKKVELLTRL